MPLIAKQKGEDFPPIRPGAYTSVCIIVADVGLSRGGRYRPQHKVFLQWELIGQRITLERDGQRVELPRVIGKFYTLSLSRKARLRADLESWRGRMFTEAELKGFDLFKILGAPCQLGIVHEAGNDGHVYVNVASIMGLTAGATRPEPESPLLKYSADEPGQFDDLPGWLRERIEQAKAQAPQSEAQAAPSPAAQEYDFDDDIPF